MTTIRSLHKREPFRRLPSFNYREGTKNRPSALATTSSSAERIIANTRALQRHAELIARLDAFLGVKRSEPQ